MRGLKRAESIAGLAILLTAAFYLSQALGYPYSSEAGAGEGFMPFWLGVGLALGALLLIFQSAMAGAQAAGKEAPERKRALLWLGTMVAAVLLMDKLGMLISVFLFTAVSAWLLGSRWWTSIAVSLGLTMLVYLLFQRWLGVPLPTGPLGI